MVDLEHGDYFQRSDIERDHPEIIAEWDGWLNAQGDPGHYETFKNKTKIPAEWITEIYMPPHLIKKMLGIG